MFSSPHWCFCFYFSNTDIPWKEKNAVLVLHGWFIYVNWLFHKRDDSGQQDWPQPSRIHLPVSASDPHWNVNNMAWSFWILRLSASNRVRLTTEGEPRKHRTGGSFRAAGRCWQVHTGCYCQGALPTEQKVTSWVHYGLVIFSLTLL